MYTYLILTCFAIKKKNGNPTLKSKGGLFVNLTNFIFSNPLQA